MLRRTSGEMCKRAFLLLLFMMVPAMVSAANAPIDVIRSGSDRALQILRSTKQEGSPSLQQRRGEILQIVDEYFNFEEMARRALGRPWRDQSPAKQQEFVRLFKDLLFNTYVDRVDTYAGGNEKVFYDSQQIEGDYAFVTTRIVGYTSSDVRVEYRLRKSGDQWKAYDVIVEGISFIDNYRGQFNAILANQSFDSLLNRMREKVNTRTTL
jgi:phospholipid transport system substrate-binding protein